MEKVKTPRQIRLKERLMRWDLMVIYIPAKSLGGNDTLSRYRVCRNNFESINMFTEIAKKMVDINSIAPWSDDSLCTLTGTQ